MRHAALFATLLLGVPSFGQTADEHAHEVVTIRVPEIPDSGPRPDLETVAKAIVGQTNAFRKAEGRAAVEVDAALAKTAHYFAAFMAKSDEYGHAADGDRPAERAKSRGYDYCVVLENIAYSFNSQGFTDAALTEKFVTGWKESPGHRRNMLDADATETGVAVARSEKTGHYYAVQMFGRPKSAATSFGVKNDADVDITYTIGEQSYTLQPRTTRTHTLCRAAGVTFRWPGGATRALTPTPGGDYTVTRDGDKFAASAGKK